MNLGFKIKTFGWQNGVLGQIQKINSGLEQIGCILTDNNPDIVFKNEDRYDEALDFADKQEKRPFVILNVLDIQDNPNWPADKVKEQLSQADVVTCISETVKKEIKGLWGIDAVNIGNPMNEVKYIPEIKKDIDFTIIGRNSDKNKRGYLFEQLLHFSKNKRTFCVVGPEPLPNIQVGWIGVVNDEKLNEIYNRSKFVICCSKREGLLLTIPEACAAGAIPIIAKDMSTAYEWGLDEFLVDPDVNSIQHKILELENNYFWFKQNCFYRAEEYKKKFSKKQVGKNIIDIYIKYKDNLSIK